MRVNSTLTAETLSLIREIVWVPMMGITPAGCARIQASATAERLTLEPYDSVELAQQSGEALATRLLSSRIDSQAQASTGKAPCHRGHFVLEALVKDPIPIASCCQQEIPVAVSRLGRGARPEAR